jgi:hypothetical protein
MWKKLIKLIRILKKPTTFVRFYKSETGKKPSQTEKKPSQPGKNRVKLVWTGFYSKIIEPNRTETGRFDSFSVWFWFFLKKTNFITYFNKNQSE